MDTSQLRDALRRGRDEFVRGLETIGADKHAKKRIGTAGWSVAQCAEQVALTEEAMLRMLATAVTPEAAMAVDRAELFLLHGADRTRTFDAPEVARPCDKPDYISALDKFCAKQGAQV